MALSSAPRAFGVALSHDGRVDPARGDRNERARDPRYLQRRDPEHDRHVRYGAADIGGEARVVSRDGAPVRCARGRAGRRGGWLGESGAVPGEGGLPVYGGELSLRAEGLLW